MMNQFPYITDFSNEVFQEEKKRIDYIFLRPPLLIFYFFLRIVVFPIKFLIHRQPWGFEAPLIDAVLAFGLKYLASHQAAKLLIRHIQIEPLIYRHLVKNADLRDKDAENRDDRTGKLSGIDGDYNVETLKQIVHNHMTVEHDELAYEIVDRFDKAAFLENLEKIRSEKPLDHKDLSKGVLEVNRKSSWKLLGSTNVVMMIVITITIIGDLRTSIKALNSFGSDSIVLWAMKHIYRENPDVMTDLDFYMQVYSNRGHYNSSAFFSDPSQYLYYHIVFDEFVYHTLRHSDPLVAA